VVVAVDMARCHVRGRRALEVSSEKVECLSVDRSPAQLNSVQYLYIKGPLFTCSSSSSASAGLLADGFCRAVVGRSRKNLPLMTLMARPLSCRAGAGGTRRALLHVV